MKDTIVLMIKKEEIVMDKELGTPRALDTQCISLGPVLASHNHPGHP